MVTPKNKNHSNEAQGKINGEPTMSNVKVISDGQLPHFAAHTWRKALPP